jgi:hypothetical protein
MKTLLVCNTQVSQPAQRAVAVRAFSCFFPYLRSRFTLGGRCVAGFTGGGGSFLSSHNTQHRACVRWKLA